MSDNEAIDEINRVLGKELEGIDYEGIANYKLRSLDREYNRTIAANVVEENKYIDPGWEADFSETAYQQCPSDEEEVTDEIPVNYTRELHLSEEKIEKIKNIMAKIKINPPYWARNIPDSVFSEHLKTRILK